MALERPVWFVTMATATILLLCAAVATGRSTGIDGLTNSTLGETDQPEHGHVIEGSTDGGSKQSESVKVVETGCLGHRCHGDARCDDTEGVLLDTGLPYSCRCPRGMVGIFCNIKKSDACKGCSSPKFYCQGTNMHWSGRFCFDRTKDWQRAIGRCGRHGFECDVGKTCVHPAALCNGVTDCADAADELFCKDA